MAESLAWEKVPVAEEKEMAGGGNRSRCPQRPGGVQVREATGLGERDPGAEEDDLRIPLHPVPPYPEFGNRRDRSFRSGARLEFPVTPEFLVH